MFICVYIICLQQFVKMILKCSCINEKVNKLTENIKKNKLKVFIDQKETERQSDLEQNRSDDNWT